MEADIRLIHQTIRMQPIHRQSSTQDQALDIIMIKIEGVELP